jgi:hypothetical protein
MAKAKKSQPEPISSPAAASMRSPLLVALPAMLLAAAVLLPFLDKAFTVDDTLFLKQAQHLLTDPLHPTAFSIVWSEFPWPVRMSAIMPSGPVTAYLLIPCVSAGGQEWIGHITQLLMFMLGLVAVASLAMRLGRSEAEARVASLILVSTPVALAMASNCMPDVPAMALGLVGIERIVAWREDRRLHQLVIAVAALIAAALARPHLAVLWGTATLVMVGDARSLRSWKGMPRLNWFAVAALPALAVVILLVTRDPEAPIGAFVGAAKTFGGFKNVANNAVAFSAHWSLVIPFAIPWVVLHPKRMLKRVGLYASAIGAVIVLQARGAHHPYLVGAAAGIGIASVWDVFHDGWRRKDSIQLVLGSWLLVSIPVLFYQHLPSKYQLASAPAVAILVATALARQSAQVRRFATAAIVIVGVGLGHLIVRADNELAELGRRAARELIAPNVAAGRRVWFDGHWGFQWYAEKAGAVCLTATPPRPAFGDLAVSSLRTGGGVNALFPGRVLVQTLPSSPRGGRIMSFALDAGFYGTAWGYLPWAWGNDVTDRYELWRLQ